MMVLLKKPDDRSKELERAEHMFSSRLDELIQYMGAKNGQVAKLAGLPESVINRATDIVAQLLNNDITESLSAIAPADLSKKNTMKALDDVDKGQLSFMDTVSDEDVLNEIKGLNISELTPLDALNTLYRLQGKLKNRY